jgi:hypothetical protein
MSGIVSIEYFQHQAEGQGLFATPRAVSAELVAPTNRGWVRKYKYPQSLLAVGEVLASIAKQMRPATNEIAALAHRVKELLYDGLVTVLEVTGRIPTGRKDFGLVQGETLSERKVSYVQMRNRFVKELTRSPKGGWPEPIRAELITKIDDISRELDRVSAVQAARKGW